MQHSMGPNIANKETNAGIYLAFAASLYAASSITKLSCVGAIASYGLMALYLRQMIRYTSAAGQLLRYKATLYTFYTRDTTQHL